MMFLTPAALWTLAALALPLAIHLWRRPPRTVRLGSLRFLETSARRWQNLRWRELALLLARLALLGTLALTLARPVWRQPPPIRAPRWALLDPTAAPTGPSLDRLHALQSTGVETRLLAPAFPTVHALPADASAPPPDLWSLLREADATLPAGSVLAVFSPGRLVSLRGVRPALTHARVEWVDTPVTPLQSAIPPVAVAVAPPLTVLILHDADRAEEARYVAAALRAVSETDPQRPLTISVATIPASAPAADWIFWLSAQPPPPAVATHTAHVLTDAPSPPVTVARPSWIVPQPGAPGTTALLDPVRLWQRGSPIAGSVVWTDSFGEPLLTRTRDPHGERWHFASRFNPAWNDLPLGSALPASLRTLLAADAIPPDENDDHRLADPAQCLPSTLPPTSAPKLAYRGTEIDLYRSLWVLAALLFGVERLLSCRRLPTPNQAAAPRPEPAFAR